MIRISQLKLPIGHATAALEKKIQKALHLQNQPFTYQIRRQSLDARHKEDKKFVYTIDVKTDNENRILKKVHDKNITLTHEKAYCFPKPGPAPLHSRPVIVGSGPAGLMCAWYLAKAGYAPLLLERGEEAHLRQQKVEAFWKNGLLDPDSNVQFGEGGAGTFSDGKLNTLVKDTFGRNQEVLKRFVEAGAGEEILYQQKPHLGTDMLVGIVENLRNQIQEMGGTVRFNAKVTDLIFEQDKLQAVKVNDQEVIPAQICVLAIGHSARDTFGMLYEKELYMESKSFAVGLRIQHPQSMINQALYGEAENPILGSASYKVTHTCDNQRGVYSFCMCPGGYVVNASSEEQMLAVNGMSYQARDSENANSAIIVTVSPDDFPGNDPMAGIRFQRDLERKAWEAGKGKVPVQLFEDYQKHQESTSFGQVKPCICGAYTLTDVRKILPEEIGDSIEEGILAFGKRLPGFDRPDALLCGIESRTSSPVRIVRDKELEGSKKGIYPCGEGAGYAGGITSAAMDGLKVAEAIARKYSIPSSDADKNS